GPEIRSICMDKHFENQLGRSEKRAFRAFRDVSWYVLSSKVHPDSSKTNQVLVDEMFDSFEIMKCHLTYKMHLLRSHLDLFPENIDDFSDQHGEKLHQLFKRFEEDY